MARSAAELRALVHSANQEMENAQNMMRAAKQTAENAAVLYRAISEKTAGAATFAVQSESSVDNAIVQASLAIDQANQYAALL